MECLQIRVSGSASLLIGILITLPTITMAADLAPPEAYSMASEIRNVAISPSGKFVAYQFIENDQNRIIVLDTSAEAIVFSAPIGDSFLRSMQFVSDEFITLVHDLNRGENTGALIDSHIMLAIGPGHRWRRRTTFIDLKEGGFQKNFIARAPGDIVGVASDGTMIRI